MADQAHFNDSLSSSWDNIIVSLRIGNHMTVLFPCKFHKLNILIHAIVIYIHSSLDNNSQLISKAFSRRIYLYFSSSLFVYKIRPSTVLLHKL